MLLVSQKQKKYTRVFGPNSLGPKDLKAPKRGLKKEGKNPLLLYQQTQEQNHRSKQQ